MNRATRRHVDALRHRRAYLVARVRDARLEDLRGPSVEFDRRELAALHWTIRLIENADAAGDLSRLAALSGTTERGT